MRQNTYMKFRAGARRLFAMALRPILSQLSGERLSSKSSASESSGSESSSDFCPPMNWSNFETKSSTSNAPDPDFIARAFWAPIFDAIRSKCESRVASCGPLTISKENQKYEEGQTIEPAFIEQLVCLMHL